MTSHKKEIAKKMGVKGYKHVTQHTVSGEKRGYKDPKTGLTHPSKGAFKDRYQGKSNWTDGLDKSKYSPEKLARWKADSERAKAQFDRQHNSQFRNQSANTPALRAWQEGNKKKK